MNLQDFNLPSWNHSAYQGFQESSNAASIVWWWFNRSTDICLGISFWELVFFFIWRTSMSFSKSKQLSHALGQNMVIQAAKMNAKTQRTVQGGWLSSRGVFGQMKKKLSNEKKGPSGWLFDVGDEMIPNYMGIHKPWNKDPYQTNRIQWNVRFCFRCSGHRLENWWIEN